MARTQGFRLTLRGCLLQLATLISASPLHSVARRDSTTTTTTWIAPTTVTVNPRDPTITREAGWTTTTGPPPFTSTITSSCITYDYSYPPADHPPSVTTQTVTARSTVTVTDTNRPLETQYSFHTPTVTATTPLATYVSYHCLNTLIVQYHSWEYLTWTWSNWEHTATTTGLCLTTSTRSTTIPGVTLPAPDSKSLEDWEYFSEPGQSVATKNSVAIVTDTSATIAGTTTRTVCDGRNPSPVTTTTITVTRQSTTTKTVTGGGQCTTVTGRAPEPRARSGAEGAGSGVEARQGGNTPVEVRTVVYTTVTVVSNMALTLTGTAVVDVNTQSFPVTRIAYVTRTGAGVVTATATVC
ncbi:hypothetical protein C8A01DRAFT_35134 [Parachaetomium inaequale]|uniref:Uncharacterized protein n=1 Tax=Parachaetomium inaequale TaxID=2588326 RepID=A0AAN6SRW9_9PEZI|nr:hypothetical protein C8A01DRAFT_35134 [Parachaetomium inaequale]